MIAAQDQSPPHATDLPVERSIINQMIEEIEGAAAIYHPSPFWKKLSLQGLEQLERDGLHNFKRTVNMRYFNWGFLGIVAHQLLPMVRQWLSDREAAPLSARFDTGLGIDPSFAPLAGPQGLLYKTYVALLSDFVARDDPQNLVGRLQEPGLGNPYRIRYRDRATSQDLCNSIHEYYSATRSLADQSGPLDIAELGAGYGRTAYAFLNARPGSTYTVIDIPAALYVAQEYLKRVFPEERVFSFRPFADFGEVEAEFRGARLRFLAANQVELLPRDMFDLTLNISSLHEMTREQIHHYLREIDRITKGRFYTKQWNRSIAKENNFVIRRGEYPIPPAWRTVYDEPHPIQSWFFHAVYETRP